jgi:hypothetical protein
MVSRSSQAPVIRSQRSLPRAGSPLGDQKRDAFKAHLKAILGEVELEWLANPADTTTSTTTDKNGLTITWDATVTARFSTQGSGSTQNFDASNDEGDIPDNAALSFTGGVPDQPLTIVALVDADDATPTAAATIVARWNKDTDAELREWRFFLTASNGYPTFEMYDESANAYIGRQDQTALTADTMTLLIATYDGGGSNANIDIMVNAVVLDDANSASGVYIGMENLGVVTSIGHTLSAASTPAAEEFWDGDIGFIVVSRSHINVDQAQAILDEVNSFYDLSL